MRSPTAVSPGKAKIMLETYVQMAYFDRILHRANVRLMVMSGGQYELKRRSVAADVRSQSGLDLDVLDHYNGTERSADTLSGGEAFLASLSLALGLSDEVQASAGGIQMDTLFVDEGFGSLSEQALELALQALAGLSDGNPACGHHLPRGRAQGTHRPADRGLQGAQRRKLCSNTGRKMMRVPAIARKL